MTRHRFRPRYRGLALASIGVGGVLVIVSAVVGFVVIPLVSGAIGLAAGTAYLASPTWKLEVIADDDGLEVSSPDRKRFRIAWSDVVKVIASPSTNSCFVDTGAPATSLLVPGVGAPAPYDLVDRPALFAAILAHVPADRVEVVERLELALAAANEAKADAKPAKT